jgi:hypothetical protein
MTNSDIALIILVIALAGFASGMLCAEMILSLTN